MCVLCLLSLIATYHVVPYLVSYIYRYVCGLWIQSISAMCGFLFNYRFLLFNSQPNSYPRRPFPYAVFTGVPSSPRVHASILSRIHRVQLSRCLSIFIEFCELVLSRFPIYVPGIANLYARKTPTSIMHSGGPAISTLVGTRFTYYIYRWGCQE